MPSKGSLPLESLPSREVLEMEAMPIRGDVLATVPPLIELHVVDDRWLQCVLRDCHSDLGLEEPGC